MSNTGNTDRWGMSSELWPFVVLGSVAIIAAGLFSALTARSASYDSAWLVAYLVLVVGVAQIVLGVGQSGLASVPPRPGVISSEIVLFNFGNIGVVLGTLLAMPFSVDVGSALLIASLILFVKSVGVRRHTGLAIWGYRVLVVFLLASVIVGIFFAHR